jgi:hypothetical protein
MAAEQMIFDIANSLYVKIINFGAVKSSLNPDPAYHPQIHTLDLYLLTG